MSIPYLLQAGGTPVPGGSHPGIYPASATFLCRQPFAQSFVPTDNRGDYVLSDKGYSPLISDSAISLMWHRRRVKCDLSTSHVIIPGTHQMLIKSDAAMPMGVSGARSQYSATIISPIKTPGDVNSPYADFLLDDPLLPDASINVTAHAEMGVRRWLMAVVKGIGVHGVSTLWDQGKSLVDGDYMVFAIRDTTAHFQMVTTDPAVPIHKPDSWFSKILYDGSISTPKASFFPGMLKDTWEPSRARKAYNGGPSINAVPKTPDGKQLNRGGWGDLQHGITTPRRYTFIFGRDGTHDPSGNPYDRVKMVEIANGLPDLSDPTQQYVHLDRILKDGHNNAIPIPDSIRKGFTVHYQWMVYDPQKEMPLDTPEVAWTDFCVAGVAGFNL